MTTSISSTPHPEIPRTSQEPANDPSLDPKSAGASKTTAPTKITGNPTLTISTPTTGSVNTPATMAPSLPPAASMTSGQQETGLNNWLQSNTRTSIDLYSLMADILQISQKQSDLLKLTMLSQQQSADGQYATGVNIAEAAKKALMDSAYGDLAAAGCSALSAGYSAYVSSSAAKLATPSANAPAIQRAENALVAEDGEQRLEVNAQPERPAIDTLAAQNASTSNLMDHKITVSRGISEAASAAARGGASIAQAKESQTKQMDEAVQNLQRETMQSFSTILQSIVSNTQNATGMVSSIMSQLSQLKNG